MRLSCLALVLLFLATGCVTIPRAPLLSEVGTCRSPVVGTVTTEARWEGPTPMVVAVEGSKHRALRGRVLAETAEGVEFDEGRQSPLFDPEPRVYTFDELALYVDDEGVVQHGTAPDALYVRWQMDWIVRHGGTGAQQMLSLDPNHSFGYCLEPGTYEVTQIAFRSGKEDVDIVSNPGLFFDAVEGYETHVGQLVLNGDTTGAILHKELSAQVVQRKGDATRRAVIGMMFGLAGTLVDAALTSTRRREHVLSVVHPPAADSVATRRVGLLRARPSE